MPFFDERSTLFKQRGGQSDHKIHASLKIGQPRDHAGEATNARRQVTQIDIYFVERECLGEFNPAKITLRQGFVTEIGSSESMAKLTRLLHDEPADAKFISSSGLLPG